jgi:hypothetical protein
MAMLGTGLLLVLGVGVFAALTRTPHPAPQEPSAAPHEP